MIDSHCHIDVGAFDADRAAVIDRALAAGVRLVVVPAIRPSAWPGLRSLAAAHPSLRIALGLHPQAVPGLSIDERFTPETLARSALDVGAVAIGECGLDGPTGDHDAQEQFLRIQIRAARLARLPLLIHVYRAHHIAPRLLAEERVDEVGGVLHSYSGPADLIPRYARLNLLFSFAGPITWPEARRPVAAARAIPRELLLAETDAPDQAPAPHRHRRSEPAFLGDVIAGLAAARSESPEDLASLTASNARRLLRLVD